MAGYDKIPSLDTHILIYILFVASSLRVVEKHEIWVIFTKYNQKKRLQTAERFGSTPSSANLD